MKIMKLIIQKPWPFWVFLVVFAPMITQFLYAGPLLEQVEVQMVSSTGKSLILNSGHLEGLKRGDYAQVIGVLGSSERPRLKSLGYAEVVRVTPRGSYWFFHDQNRAHRVSSGDTVSLIRKDKALQGLREQKVLQRKLVLSSGQKFEDELAQRERGLPKELLSGHQKDYYSRELNLKSKNVMAYDLETSQYDVWSTKNRPEFIQKAMKEFEVDYIGQLKNVSHADKVRREDSDEVFRSYVQSIVQTLNSKKEGLNELYQRELDKSYKNYVGDVLVKRNLYHQVRDPDEKRLGLKPHALQKIKRDGPLWSADLDDQQLREFMVKTGVAQELERREKVQSELEAHEVIFRASTGLVKHVNVDDPNFQNVNYSLSASYEYSLSRASEKLAAWTLEAEVYTGINFYEMAAGLNGRFQENGFGAAVNYYFYNKPFTVEKLAFYGGMGLRRSSASGGSSLLDGQQSFDYQVLSLPILHLGAKYRFRAGDSYKDIVNVGMGLNALLSFESKNLSVVGENEIQGPVFSSFDIQDTRLAVGLSLYF